MDLALLDEGQALVRTLVRRGMPGPYQVQAAIQAVHTDALPTGAVDHRRLLELYDLLLLQLAPTPIVALNRAMAVADVHGAAEALALALTEDPVESAHLQWRRGRL